MAAIKIGYVGGGSSRGPGTVASWISQGANFAGSEIVLIDLNPDRLALVKQIADKMAKIAGHDIRFSATTDRRAGLRDCDVVLSSYRPGGFEARCHDEAIPLKHGVIGQETQGPGGFFMALRSIHVMKGIVADMEAVCPKAWLFNYTNPVNIVSEAVTRNCAIPTVSLCEGPIEYPRELAKAVGLDPKGVDAVMIGLNHGSWTVRHLHDGGDLVEKITAAADRWRKDISLSLERRRHLELTMAMGCIPSQYFQYYYFRDEILEEQRNKPTTRAQDILANVPKYWEHYREQAQAKVPALDPKLSRGGLHELELAVDVMDAMFNDRKEVWPVNVPNKGSISDLDEDLVIEGVGLVQRSGITPLASGSLPKQGAALTYALAEYQTQAAHVAWNGSRREAVQVLASHPLVMSLRKAEAIYDELAAAQRDYLPERLLS